MFPIVDNFVNNFVARQGKILPKNDVKSGKIVKNTIQWLQKKPPFWGSFLAIIMIHFLIYCTWKVLLKLVPSG